MKKFLIILFLTFPCFSYATWDIEMKKFSPDNLLSNKTGKYSIKLLTINIK